MRLIENPTNRGFPAAVNQAIVVATGDQILLLNNDTILTTGWLGRMLRVLHSEPSDRSGRTMLQLRQRTAAGGDWL